MALASCLSVLAMAGDGPNSKMVPARDLEERGIAGALGPQLGTVIRVRGTVEKGDPRQKATASNLYLRAESVGETKSIKPPAIQISFDSEKKVKAGDRITCVGWEIGVCRGILHDPENLLETKGAMRVADTDYRFHTEFVIARIE